MGGGGMGCELRRLNWKLELEIGIELVEAANIVLWEGGIGGGWNE
jgi:hypothetical protein